MWKEDTMHRAGIVFCPAVCVHVWFDSTCHFQSTAPFTHGHLDLACFLLQHMLASQMPHHSNTELHPIRCVKYSKEELL